MLSMRARGYRLRDSFGDVLGGLYLREEFIGGQTIEHDAAEIAAPRQMEPPAPPTPPIMDAPPEPPVTKQYAMTTPEPSRTA